MVGWGPSCEGTVIFSRRQPDIGAGAAESSRKLHKPARIVFATHDERLVRQLREITSPGGIEVLSLTDLAWPEPSCSERDASRTAIHKATVIAGLADLPAIGHARCFRIDPLLRWSGGGPQWAWPVPWPHAREELVAEMKGAADELNAGGYCGPDDRGAYFQCVLCLAWPDAEMRMFEGRAEGQFVWPWSVTRHGRLILDLETCFVPESESIALSCLDGERRRKYSDEQRAFAAVGRGLSI